MLRIGPLWHQRGRHRRAYQPIYLTENKIKILHCVIIKEIFAPFDAKGGRMHVVQTGGFNYNIFVA